MVSVIQAASRMAMETTSSGMADFHVLIFSWISARSMAMRVSINWRSSSLVSASTVAMDFSLGTVRPPQTKRGSRDKAHDACRQHCPRRMLMHGAAPSLQCPRCRIAHSPTQLSGLIAALLAQGVGPGGFLAELPGSREDFSTQFAALLPYPQPHIVDELPGLARKRNRLPRKAAQLPGAPY